MATARDFMIRQAAMYQAYHRDHRNVLTHVFGVPMIMFAVLLALHRVHFGWIAPSYFPGLTLGWIATIGFGVWYVAMDRVAGGLLAAALIIASLAAAPMALWSAGAFWIAFLVFFVGGWIIQLIGHSVFEGRRPALTDNILQIFVAPIFLVLEALYRAGSHHDLRDEIERLSHAYNERPAAAE